MFFFLLISCVVVTVNSQSDYGIYWNGLTRSYLTGICPTGSKTTSTQFGYHGYQFQPDSTSRYQYNDSVHCIINIQGPNPWDEYQNLTQYMDVYSHYVSFGINNCSYAYIKIYSSATCTFGTTDLIPLATYCGTGSFSATQLDLDPIATRCVQIEIFLADITNWINVTALAAPVSPFGTALICDYNLSSVYKQVNNSCFYNLQNDNTMDFLIDATSYYNGICNSTYINSKYQFQCAPPSSTMRCIHMGFRCNGYGMRGCKDSAAHNSYEPSFCFGTTPTVYDLLPLWIILGILGGLLATYILYWLLWRTGWLVWHLGRCRHYKLLSCCFKLRLCSKCSSCCKSMGNSCACCAKLCSGCENCCSGKTGQIGNNIDSSTGYGKKPLYKRPNRSNNLDLTDSSNRNTGLDAAGGAWLNFFQGDGGHLRELRF